jgi:ferritin-like metal-binding protein YciE
MAGDRLKKLYVDELKDLYSAENQLVKALPKMAKAASSEQLRKGFEQHLQQTRGHVVNCTLRVRQENWGQLFCRKDCNRGVGCGARGRLAPLPHAAM